MSKLGFDIHGVIDTNPHYFAQIIKGYRSKGHKVHIITGTPFEEMRDKLSEWGIEFDGYFSIATWCLEHSATATVRDGQVYDTYEQWNNAKALYCMREGIDVHVDDSTIYQNTFKNISTRFFLYKEDNRMDMKQVIASADTSCEHYPCTKSCPQYILYRNKVRKVLERSEFIGVYEAHNEYGSDYLEEKIDKLVDEIFEEL